MPKIVIVGSGHSVAQKNTVSKNSLAWSHVLLILVMVVVGRANKIGCQELTINQFRLTWQSSRSRRDPVSNKMCK